MASLADKLAALRQRVKLKPEIAALMFRHHEELRKQLSENGPLSIGDHLPAFELPDHRGVSVRSEELLARGPLVVSLFRGTWCGYCDVELQSLNDIYTSVLDLGSEIVALSPQSPESASEYLSAHPVSFRILVDAEARFAASLGLAYRFPGYLEELYRDVFKVDLQRINAGGLWQLPIPGRLVVDQLGTIIDAEYNPDFRYRPAPGDLVAELADLRAGFDSI